MLGHGNEITIAVDPRWEQAKSRRRKYVRRPRTREQAFENGSWKRQRGSRRNA